MKKEETKVGFKVLRKIGNHLVSATRAGLKVRYIRDTFAVPRVYGGPLTLFTDEDTAISFKNAQIRRAGRSFGAFRVYKSEYVPTNCQHVWRYRKGELRGKKLRELPIGTVLARKVMIRKSI